MINAEVTTAANNMIMVRFSEPDEKFQNNNWIPVQNVDEVKRRIYFKNRIYILSQLSSWLNQREHASHSFTKECKQLKEWLSGYQNSSFYSLCEFIKRKRSVFEDVAPGDQSKYYNHYINTIVPILDFAEKDENNQR
ncbi:hypothetical protein OQZ33_04275 [Pedobacter sp. MC2016-05]|uniref:hypothetical protein n=1 Tax=Pedobacter sp. MC2016-05 TaxID=2994474 RepID=UPI002245DC5B|nr:hypothetical protein [Pedobacter sp. MC2016-05]MCX2473542.1 hypothetical protein [Pedobacter sp. MC2016-05]